MGFFDSLFGRKSSPPPRAHHPAEPGAEPAEPPHHPGGPLPGQDDTAVVQRPVAHELDLPAALAEARGHLEKRDLPSALQIYEVILQSGADLAGPLTTISGDLGATGHIEAMAELLAPVYERSQHGPLPGINLLQAYLHLRNEAAAQQLLDVLTEHDDGSLADRLDGFRTALTRLRKEPPPGAAAPAPAAEIALATITKPLFTYGLADGESHLPAKTGRERRIAFLPVALVGDGCTAGTPAPETHPLAPLALGLPFSLLEAAWFSPNYQPVAVTGVTPQKRVFLTPVPFSGAQTKQLYANTDDAVQFGVTGTLKAAPDGAVAALEFVVWDVRKNRQLKTLAAHGAGAVAEAFRLVLAYIEAAQPGPAPLAYALPADPAAHSVAQAHALYFFLSAKNVMPAEHAGDPAARLAALAAHAQAAGAPPTAPLLLDSARRQCAALGLAAPDARDAR